MILPVLLFLAAPLPITEAVLLFMEAVLPFMETVLPLIRIFALRFAAICGSGAAVFLGFGAIPGNLAAIYGDSPAF